MPKHAEKRVLPHSAEQMFDLVADVGKYPDFLPWCIGARVFDQTDDVLYADLVLGYKVFREKFRSKVDLYRPDRIARPADWALPIRPGDLWCDDPRSEDYNLMVRAPFSGSHERLRRADPLYDIIFLTDWNWPRAARGKGSAIFLHRWRRPGAPTEGCVAFRPADLAWIAPRIDFGTRLFVTAQP